MKHGNWIVFLCLASALPAAHGQMQKCSMVSGGVMNGLDGKYTATLTYNPLPMGKPGMLPGRPYAGEEIAQRVQTLPDGTRVVDPRPSTFHYRDSAGRTRTERPLARSSVMNHGNIPVVPEIFDPVEGSCVYLDTVNRVAHRVRIELPVRVLTPPEGLTFPMPVTIAMGGRSSAAAAASATERLGPMTIEGVEARGTRTTTTYPAGAMGNDQPMTVSRENWVSEELNVTVLSKVTDPRQGEDLQALVNISREEPDGSLFEIPRGYRVVEETLPFQVTFSGRAE